MQRSRAVGVHLTSSVSNGEYGTLSSASAPLFVSLFPERDRNCHIMVHDYSDCNMLKRPLGYLEGVPLNNLMTLQNFIDGGYDVTNSRILVVVKSIGARKKGKAIVTARSYYLLWS